MSHRRTRRQVRAAAPSPSRRHYPRVAAFVLAIAVIGSITYALWEMNHQNMGSSAVPKAAVQPVSPPAVAGQPKVDFQRLEGRWLRPDGGYILEVANVLDSGAMEVSYFNPQPIHVSRSEASWDGAQMTVFIELRDTHYPGCTYRLLYLPASDQLAGIYYQAAIQQQFEVVFVRMK